MPDRTQESRQRRSDARSRRRANAEEPLEEVGEAAQDQAGNAMSASNGALSSTAAKVVGTMVGAALLSAAGAAAKVLLERRGSAEASPTTKSDEDTETGAEEQTVPEPSGEADDQPDLAEHEPESAEPEPELAGQDVEHEDEEPEPDTAEQDVEEDAQEQPEPAQGVAAGNGAAIIEDARRELGSLLGTEPERVSGLERNEDGWTVMLDVVELSRIPESTDVLATYEVKLDGEHNLVGATRTRRYVRSQIEEAS